jgi:hypothetical protein
MAWRRRERRSRVSGRAPGGHVDFVERREHRCLRLGLQQALGDARA